MIKAVFFDLWNTLVTGGVNNETLLTADQKAFEYLQSKGCKIAFEEYRKRKKECFQKYENLAKGFNIHLSPETAFKEFVFKDMKIKDADLKKIVKIHEIYEFHWEFRKDCEQVLKELKKKSCKIALVTNSWLRQSTYFLKKEGLYKYFDAIIVSCDIGFGKPDKRIFEIAAKELGVKISECAHVGDKHKQDIAGAHEAGITCAIGIEPFSKNDSLKPPIAVVKTLSEIIPVISKN